MTRRVLFVGIPWLVSVSPSLQAQPLASLQGLVSDETGGRLPGVSIVVHSFATGLERTAVTDRTGFYRAPLLPPGDYLIRASLDGFQTLVLENVALLVGQTLDVNLTLSVAALNETVTVTAESPVLELSRSSAAKYVTEEEINGLPIAGRDFSDFALLQPTVRTDSRGAVSLAGQKGISSGLAIDGTEAKSAFFGYGRGGEATENDGLVIAQDSVKEFQVITSGFAPEYGRTGGGYINVVTKSGTNRFRGSGFVYFRDNDLASRMMPTDLDRARGKTGDEAEFDPSEFERYNWGLTFGGPVRTNRTHFFLAYDQASRSDPFIQDIRGRGQYDAVMARYPSLLRGFSPNDDGLAAPDPVRGRTATGQFVRELANLVLFFKLTHQINDRSTLAVRYNATRYERRSDFKAEESLKSEDTGSFVASLVSVLGAGTVNELRFQYARDRLDRLTNLEEGDLLAYFRIERPSYTAFGKPSWLPIYSRENKFQIQDNLSYNLGRHDLKLGTDIQVDRSSQFLTGGYDGTYDFRTIDAFLTNADYRARLWFTDSAPPPTPNFVISQKTVAIYGQDSWRPHEKLTLNYGLRWDGTFNPGGFQHALPEGREIPDDLDNFAPRIGVTYSPDDSGRSVIRGGVGLFHARTPAIIFFNLVQDNGIYPNLGRVTLAPDQPGHVPMGYPVDRTNPPSGVPPSLGIVSPGFEDAETWRLNLGYEREVAPDWAASFDFLYARSGNQQSNADINVYAPVPDASGRPIYPSGRPSPEYGQVMSRMDISRSEFVSGTVAVSKRWSRGYQLQAHYTLARDRDNDSNERSATGITLTNYLDPDYDYGLSERDIRHRFVVSGVVEIPFALRVSGIGTFQSGAVYSALDPDMRLTNHPTATLQARAVIDGILSRRNSFRGPSLKNVDLRVAKSFDIGRTRLDGIFEVFNLLNWGNFVVGTETQDYYVAAGSLVADPEFGIAGSRAGGPTFGNQRQIQLGIRVTY